MRPFGHYEEASVRGSHRKVRVYVPSLFKHILISLAVFFVPFLCVNSAARSFAELREMVLESLGSPFCLIFYAILLILALMTFWANRLFARDTRRMLAGQLEVRTGVLWAIGQQSGGRYPGPWRLAIDTQDAAGRPLRDELYPIPEKLYRRHIEERTSQGRGYAWLVELAVLPPEEGPAFTEAAADPAPNSGAGHLNFRDIPVFRGEVAEIFYLECQPYGCYIGSDLFPKEQQTQ